MEGKPDIAYKSVYDYLDSLDIMDTASAEEIELAKKEYWKLYRRQHKQGQRKRKPEVNVSFRDRQELGKMKKEAKRHKMPLSVFLRESSMAYVNQDFVQPNKEIWGDIEQAIAMSELKLCLVAEDILEEGTLEHAKIQQLVGIVISLKHELDELLNKPQLVTNAIENLVIQQPWKKQELQNILNRY